MEQGKVRLASGKNFGFVKAADGTDVFVHPSSYPGRIPVLDGDEISFEIDSSGPKGPRVANVAIINRGTPVAPRPTPTTTPTPTASTPSEIEVYWNFGAPIKQGRSHVLPLTLIIVSNKQPKAGVEVKLKSNNNEVNDPDPEPSSDGEGKVHFLVLLDASKIYSFVASYKDDGKDKRSSYIWEKRPSKKAAISTTNTTPATDAEKKLPEIEVVNPPRDPDPTTGLFLVNVVTRKDGKKTNRSFTAFCDQVITIMQPSPTGFSSVTTFAPVTTGQYQLYVNIFPGVMVKIVFKLDNGREAKVWLRK